MPLDPESHNGIVILPAFADEMNKSRHMLNLLSKKFCDENYHVITPDLFGTGDSHGNHKEANWETWLVDIETTIKYLEEQGVTNVSLLGLRTGALLAADAISRSSVNFKHLVLWHPVIDGNVFISQFLRLRLAAGMISNDQKKETTKELLEKLLSGECVEVAGYDLSPELALTLKEKSLKNVQDSLPNTTWIDIVPSSDRSPPVVNNKLVQSWAELDIDVKHEKCVGEAFWGSVEIVELPALVDMTIDLVMNADGS